jgi:hypothetical protein
VGSGAGRARGWLEERPRLAADDIGDRLGAGWAGRWPAASGVEGTTMVQRATGLAGCGQRHRFVGHGGGRRWLRAAAAWAGYRRAWRRVAVSCGSWRRKARVLAGRAREY